MLGFKCSKCGKTKTAGVLVARSEVIKPLCTPICRWTYNIKIIINSIHNIITNKVVYRIVLYFLVY